MEYKYFNTILVRENELLGTTAALLAQDSTYVVFKDAEIQTPDTILSRFVERSPVLIIIGEYFKKEAISKFLSVGFNKILIFLEKECGEYIVIEKTTREEFEEYDEFESYGNIQDNIQDNIQVLGVSAFTSQITKSKISEDAQPDEISFSKPDCYKSINSSSIIKTDSIIHDNSKSKDSASSRPLRKVQYETMTSRPFHPAVNTFTSKNFYENVPVKGTLESLIMEKIMCFVLKTYKSNLDSEKQPVNADTGKYLIQGLHSMHGSFAGGLTTLRAKSIYKAHDYEAEMTLRGRLWYENVEHVCHALAAERVNTFIRRVRKNGYDGACIHAYDLEKETRQYIEKFMNVATDISLTNPKPNTLPLRETKDKFDFGVMFKEIAAEKKNADADADVGADVGADAKAASTDVKSSDNVNFGANSSVKKPAVFVNGYLVKVFVKRSAVPDIEYDDKKIGEFVKNLGISYIQIDASRETAADSYIFTFYVENGDEMRKLCDYL